MSAAPAQNYFSETAPGVSLGSASALTASDALRPVTTFALILLAAYDLSHSCRLFTDGSDRTIDHIALPASLFLSIVSALYTHCALSHTTARPDSRAHF